MTDQKPPGRIYLQAGSQGSYEIGQDATWCDHQIDDEDVEYVLASEPESAQARRMRLETADSDALTDDELAEDLQNTLDDFVDVFTSEPESVEPEIVAEIKLRDGVTSIESPSAPESASVGEGDWSEEAKCRVAVFLRDYHFIAKGQDKRTDMPPALVWWSDAEELLALLATHTKPVVFCRCGDGIEDPTCKTCYMTDREDAEPVEPDGIDQALSDAHDVGWANASGRQIRTKALLKESQVAAVMTGRTTLELALCTPEARETVGWIPAQKNHASPVKTDYYIIPIRYIRLGHHPTPTGADE